MWRRLLGEARGGTRPSTWRPRSPRRRPTPPCRLLLPPSAGLWVSAITLSVGRLHHQCVRRFHSLCCCAVTAGVCSLVVGTLVTWCSSLVVASLWRWNGEKHTNYRLLAQSIFGPWGYWYVSFFQQVASVGNNIAIQIAAGSSLKAVYKHYHHTVDGGGGSSAMTLQQFILVFGALELLLSQLPDIHSLRWVNAICTASTLGFAGTTIGVTIYDGNITLVSTYFFFWLLSAEQDWGRIVCH